MSFIEGFLVGRAVSGRRPYRKATGFQAATLYPGGALVGFGILLAVNDAAPLGVPLLVVGGILFLAGCCAGKDP